MKVTSENYVELAVNTEAPITIEMKNRIRKSVTELLMLMDKQIELGNKLDKLKKYMYYGKGSESSGFTPVDQSTENRVIENEVIRLIHCALGVATESTEIFEALQKHIVYNEDLDKVNFQEEISDLYWYAALGLNTIDKTMNDTLQININKLAARYPERFTEYHAINRDLETEREILVNNK